jgi:nicotinamide-nucleotide amidase
MFKEIYTNVRLCVRRIKFFVHFFLSKKCIDSRLQFFCIFVVQKRINKMNKTVEEIQMRMVAACKTLATAESCTSGGIAREITKVAGSSDYFQGGLVAYQDRLKEQFLGVSAKDIAQYDVVSEPVARQMVRGACQLFKSDYAIASTGYAGEGCNGIPAGTIWIAWGTPENIQTKCMTKNIDRETNTNNAIKVALDGLLKSLRSS